MAPRNLEDRAAIVAGCPDPETVQWIFGYGSIIFRLGFERGHTVAGYIKDWKRVFYQSSTGAPGRTVTIVPKPGDHTWGVAFKLPDDLAERRRVLEDLEWREKQYDMKVYLDVYEKDKDTPTLTRVLTYVGSSDTTRNQNWAGEAPLIDIASQIATAVGPSGPNYEYLYLLADGLRRMEVDDAHVFKLEKLVRALRGDTEHDDKPA